MTLLNLLLLAAEAVLASMVLPLLAALLARAYPRSAGRRALVWAMMFAILLALPLAVFSPSLAVITLPAPVPIAAAPLPATAVEVEASGSSSTGAADIVMLALWAWGMGALWIVVRALAGLVWLERLRFRSAPLPPANLPLALPRGCRARLSPDCLGPMTWGVARPLILLPDDALSWPREQLEAALRHELAHVARKDSLIQALALLTCALYWPNPLVWRAARALRREAEAAADDAVIAAGVRPSDYASLLVELAGDWPSQRQVSFEMAMAAPPILTERVQSILSPEASRTGATAMDAFKLALVGGVALTALALARPSIAEIPAAAPAGPSFVAAPSGPVFIPAPAAAPAPAAKPAAPRPMVVAEAAPRPARPQDIQVSPAPPVPPAPLAGVAPLPPPSGDAVWIQGAPPPLPSGAAGPNVQWQMGWISNPNGPRGVTEFRLETNAMTPEQRAELDRKMAAIGPAIDKAIADAHIDETVQKALSAQDAKTREEVDRQLKLIGPRIQQAIASAHIQELVGQRLAQLGPELEARRKEARERQAQAEERVAAQLEEQAKRARERAQRDREQLKAAPQPAQPPKN